MYYHLIFLTSWQQTDNKAIAGRNVEAHRQGVQWKFRCHPDHLPRWSRTAGTPGNGFNSWLLPLQQMSFQGDQDREGAVHIPLRTLDLRPRNTNNFWNLLDDNSNLFDEPDKCHTKGERLGIERRSPLLDLPYFDIGYDISMDAMHIDILYKVQCWGCASNPSDPSEDLAG